MASKKDRGGIEPGTPLPIFRGSGGGCLLIYQLFGGEGGGKE